MTWWNLSWAYKQKLTLDTTILSGNVTNNHVIMVKIDSGNTDFWTNVFADGKDVRFTNAAEDTLLEYHFELFDNGTDDMVAWIHVTDTFTSGADLEIYMYYGNSDAVDAQNISATYPPAYSAVWHLEEAGTFLDSTSNNHDETGSSVTREATGKIYKGASFNGSSNYVDLGNTVGDVGTGAFTYMIWINTTTTGANQHIMGARNTASDTKYIMIFIFGSTNKARMAFDGVALESTTTIASTGWRLVTITRDGSADCKIHIDGAAAEDTGNIPQTGTSTSNANFTLGAADNDTDWTNATLDEAKVFDYGLSADEVKLLFASENDDLIIFGNQSGPEVGASPWINKYW